MVEAYASSTLSRKLSGRELCLMVDLKICSDRSFTAAVPSGKLFVTRSRTISAIDYPFTAPDVRPATIRRWKMRTKMMIGTVITIAPAAIDPVGSTNCESPEKFAIATGAVSDAVVAVERIAPLRLTHEPCIPRLDLVRGSRVLVAVEVDVLRLEHPSAEERRKLAEPADVFDAGDF